MKPRLRNRRLIRVTDALLPLALLAAAILGLGKSALLLYVSAFAVGVPSLFSACGIRAAFARQPAIRRVRGTLLAALLLQCFGLVAALGALQLLLPNRIDRLWPMICAGYLLNIEHTFYEYLFAVGDRRSAAMCHALAAALTFAGLILAGSRGEAMFWIPVTTGVSAVVAFIIGAAMGDGLKGKINAEVVRCAPRAAVQSALYPLAAFALFWGLRPAPVAAPFFAGLTLFELCRTPFRRSPLEARTFNKVLAAVAALAAAAWLALVLVLKTFAPSHVLPMACAMVFAAAACSLALFGNIRKDA